jgi:hypothetical protein
MNTVFNMHKSLLINGMVYSFVYYFSKEKIKKNKKDSKVRLHILKKLMTKPAVFNKKKHTFSLDDFLR